MSEHNDLIQHNTHNIVAYFGHKPIVGYAIGIGLTCLGFINIDVKQFADEINPYIMLLRFSRIGNYI